MDSELKRLVRSRAEFRCEYCRLPERAAFRVFHAEHILPRFHGGRTDGTNLALSCAECNGRKGTNLTGIDPDTGQVTALFNPRTQRWEDHFRWENGRVIGTTATGRTTVWVCDMNQLLRVETRWIARLADLG